MNNKRTIHLLGGISQDNDDYKLYNISDLSNKKIK